MREFSRIHTFHHLDAFHITLFPQPKQSNSTTMEAPPPLDDGPKKKKTKRLEKPLPPILEDMDSLSLNDYEFTTEFRPIKDSKGVEETRAQCRVINVLFHRDFIVDFTAYNDTRSREVQEKGNGTDGSELYFHPRYTSTVVLVSRLAENGEHQIWFPGWCPVDLS